MPDWYAQAKVDTKQAAIGYKSAPPKRSTLYTPYGHIDVNDVHRLMVGIRRRFRKAGSLMP
jgi:hypothetical protein